MSYFLRDRFRSLFRQPPAGDRTGRPSIPRLPWMYKMSRYGAYWGKISKTTGWKIKVPDKWMDKPITQTLNQVSVEEGLRFILKDAGIENLLLTYDENGKTITVYDTEIQQGHAANSLPAQGVTRPPVSSANDQPDPMLTRPAKDARSKTSRGTARAKSRRQAHVEEE